MSKRGNPEVTRPLSGLSVAYTGTAGTTSAVGAHETQVYVWTTSDAYIKFGGTATTSDFPIPADTPIRCRINPGETVSAVQISSGGTLYVGILDD